LTVPIVVIALLAVGFGHLSFIDNGKLRRRRRIQISWGAGAGKSCVASKFPQENCLRKRGLRYKEMDCWVEWWGMLYWCTKS
jgi:hypothetical protein